MTRLPAAAAVVAACLAFCPQFASASNSDIACVSPPINASTGANFAYDTVCTNNGPDVVLISGVSNNFSGGWNALGGSIVGPSLIGSTTLAVGDSLTIRFTLDATGVPAGTSFTPGPIFVTSATNTDPDSSNNFTQPAGLISGTTDLQVTLTGPGTVVAGGFPPPDYTGTVTNAGPAVIARLQVIYPVPMTPRVFSTGSPFPTPISCAAPPTPSCTYAFPAGFVGSFLVGGTVPSNVAAGTALPVHVTVNGVAGVTESSAIDNVATFISTVEADADVGVNLVSVNATEAPGGTVTWQVTLTNAGPSDAPAAQWSGTLPAGTTFSSLVNVSGSVLACTTGGAITCSGTIPAGGTSVYRIVAAIDAAATGTLSFTVGATTSANDTNIANNASMVVTALVASADLAVTMTTPPPAVPGSTLTYVITITNNGPSPATGVDLRDLYLPGLETSMVMQVSGPAFTCLIGPITAVTGGLLCRAPTLAAGASAVIQLTRRPPGGVGTVVTNTATLIASSADPSNGNNQASASTTLSSVTTFSGPSATGTGTISVVLTGGGATCSFSSPQFIPLTGHPRSPPAGSAPPNTRFPHGLFDFSLVGCTPGGAVTLAITYPSPVAGAAYWKYGPTPGNTTPHWYTLASTSAGNTVTFTITDGGEGDDDLLANGTIVDQGGPGFNTFVAAVPALSPAALAALALLALGTGLVALRRRKGPRARFRTVR